ncbi:MAG: hypothetical protein IJD81_10305 [Oscillospiraceae bacterium]|nr:hypothetical protein [Oscillospiraceae bacterium]
MYRGKHEKPVKGLKKYKRSGVVIASLLLIFALTVGTTAAFLWDRTDTTDNAFVPVTVGVDIEESFDGQTKSAVVVRNEGDIPVYIRATAAFYWTDANGVIVEPENCSHTPVVLGSGWFSVGSVYYYTAPVSSGNATSNLLASPITAQITPEFSNYVLHMEVHSEAIQAQPADAVEQAWRGVDVKGGNLTAAGG